MKLTEPLAPELSHRIAVQDEDGAWRIYDLFPIDLPKHASCQSTMLRIALMHGNAVATLDE